MASRRQVLRITAVAGLSAAFGGGLAARLLRDAGLHRVSRTGTRMGTLVTLTVVHPEADGASAMIDAAFAEMDRQEDVLSRHRPESALSRLNVGGVLEDPPPALREVLAAALGLASRSGGAFDPTVLPVLEAHRASFEASGRPPEESELRRVLALVGHEGVRLDPDRIRLDRPGMAVTLDGIAKGFIVDRTVDVLVDRGADRVLVDAGGDMAASGPGSEQDPWTVAIQDPARLDGRSGVIRLAADGVATSGDYLNSFTLDRRFHHILDPRTGRSPAETSSVSVVAPSAMQADGLSTTVMVLGPEEGLALVDATSGAHALLVTKSGRRLQTEGFGVESA